MFAVRFNLMGFGHGGLRPLVRTCLLILTGLMVAPVAMAQQQRSRPPQFDDQAISKVFFSSLNEAFEGEPPTLGELRARRGMAAQSTGSAGEGGNSNAVSKWANLITPASLEDEIKRVKLQYDATISTPGAFKGGGYQDARVNLSVLAMLFAVVQDHGGEVRWSKDAAAARDLMARTARNCAAGSTQVYNEAKLRKADLQDLLSGTGITAPPDVEDANDWAMIVDRTPMMEYVEMLLDGLNDVARSAAEVESNVEDARRQAELLATVGSVIGQDGMDDSDDEDYTGLCDQMTKAAVQVVRAIERQDYEAASSLVGGIEQSCADCHEQYR
ncbi:MAG: cytochrome c [Planctomycetota bacterium]